MVEHSDHANTDMCEWNLDIVKDTRKNDQDSTTKNASLHRPDEKVVLNEEKEEGGGNKNK